MYTTNCQVCGTKSSINSRRCRKHERTPTYTAVRYFPVLFLKTKKYVYHELQGMWYDLKHKQQKMPKARANFYVYSSTLFSGLMFEDEIVCIPRTARYVMHDMWYEIGQASLFRATERPIHAKTELKHKERGTQHCQRVFAKVRF